MNELKHHYSFTLQPEDSGQRLDKWLQLQLPDMTRSAVQKLIEQGNVTRNGMTVSKNGKGNAGDVIEVIVPQPKPLEVTAQDIPLDILYEDNDLLVVNKPKGMVVHPAAGNDDGTLVMRCCITVVILCRVLMALFARVLYIVLTKTPVVY